jgi:predicted nucleic acid-binding protein
MDVVLDSSVALAWALPDETSDRADRLLARASNGSISAARKAGIRIARPNVKASRESRVESRK